MIPYLIWRLLAYFWAVYLTASCHKDLHLLVRRPLKVVLTLYWDQPNEGSERRVER